MSETVSYHTIQAALERCMAAEPAKGIEFGLSRDASLLGDIIGEMIWRKLDSIPRQVMSGEHLAALERWLEATVDRTEPSPARPQLSAQGGAQ